MYGLSLTASLLCASATRRLASDTRRAISSDAGNPGAGEPVAGVGPLDIEGELASDAGKGTGNLGTGALIEGPVHPNAAFFMLASLAATSARFCAIMSTFESCFKGPA